MSKKWSDYVQKAKPQLLQTESQYVDTEQPSALGGHLQRARNFVLGRQEPEPQGRFISLFNCLPNNKQMGYAAVSIFMSVLMFLCCFLCLPTIVLSPATFVMCFTLSMVFLITAMAFWYGPRNQYASFMLIASILLSLYFSIISPKYVLSVVFCVLQLNAVVFYFCSTTAISMQTVQWMCQALVQSVRNKF